MKSFSSTTFDGDHRAGLQKALEKVTDDPTSILADAQWFLYAARDTVFYHCFTRRTFDDQSVKAVIGEMVELAPQLTYAYKGSHPGQPFTDAELDIIADVVEVDSFEGMPENITTASQDLFARDDLPLLRVTAYNLKGGPDAEGRASLVTIRSSHALLEGSDSALLTRSQNSGHGAMSEGNSRLGFWANLKLNLQAGSAVAMVAVLANLFAPPQPKSGFRLFALDRQRIRRLAARLGVGQRALCYALATYVLNGTGPQKLLGDKSFRLIYTLLETGGDVQADDFFRARGVITKYTWKEDFVEYVRGVQETMTRAEAKEVGGFMAFMFRMMTIQRRWARRIPALFGTKYWRFSLGVPVGMTMVPPHRATGALGKDVIEPIYCGAWHPGGNGAIFCPGRKYITLVFVLEEKFLPNAERFMDVLNKVDAMNIEAPDRAFTAQAA